MKYTVVRDDISKFAADAIVLPANTELKEGSGISTAIFKKAGRKELKKACAEALKRYKKIYVGGAIYTSAFNLDATYIIHAITPKWIDGDHHEYELLSAAYLSSLQVADALGCKSIAIPLLSSGNNGFKVPVSYELAIQTIEDYQPENKLEDVYLIVYGNQIVTMLRRQHVSISENINENYVLLKDEKYRTPVVEAALYLKDRGADFIKDNQRKLQNMLESEEGRKELFDNAVNIAKIVVPFVLNKFKEKQEDNSHNQKNN